VSEQKIKYEPKRTIKAPRKASQHRESKLQIACVNWFSAEYSHLKDLLLAIPNGGKRSKVEAGIMSAEGVKRGAPDLLLAVPFGGYPGLWIEMKVENGRVSEDQKRMQDRLVQQGYAVAVCWTLEEFMNDVNNYLTRKANENRPRTIVPRPARPIEGPHSYQPKSDFNEANHPPRRAAAQPRHHDHAPSETKPAVYAPATEAIQRKISRPKRRKQPK